MIHTEVYILVVFSVVAVVVAIGPLGRRARRIGLKVRVGP